MNSFSVFAVVAVASAVATLAVASNIEIETCKWTNGKCTDCEAAGSLPEDQCIPIQSGMSAKYKCIKRQLNAAKLAVFPAQTNATCNNKGEGASVVEAWLEDFCQNGPDHKPSKLVQAGNGLYQFHYKCEPGCRKCAELLPLRVGQCAKVGDVTAVILGEEQINAYIQMQSFPSSRCTGAANNSASFAADNCMKTDNNHGIVYKC